MYRRAFTLILTVLISFLFFPSAALAEKGFSVGPPAIDVTVPVDGKSAVYVYITSNFDGEVLVATEGLPFQVRPETVQIGNTDKNKEVELTFYGNNSLDEEVYSGKLTFLGYIGNNVACGVKIEANVTQSGETLPSEEYEGDSWLADNYLLVLLGLLGIIATLVGIMIGHKKVQTI